MLVLYLLVMIVGFGCGGRKLWVVNKVVVIGIFKCKIEVFNFFVIENIIGINKINFILKNKVIFIINEVIIIVYWIFFFLNLLIRVMVICWVFFVLVINFLSIVLSLNIKVIWLSVFFNLVLMDVMIFFIGILSVKDIIKDIIINEINVFNLNLVIKISNRIILIVIINNGMIYF